MEDISNYEKLRDDAHALYAAARPVFSPAIEEAVVFTAEGFNHVIFKRARSERERPSQIMRFKLLPRAIRLIEHANTFQEFEETVKEFEI
jgi:hypothetical protein